MTENLPAIANGFENYLVPERANHILKLANEFAKSQLVPKHFQGKPQDIFIVIQSAFRKGLDPFYALQHTYIIGGKPAEESKMLIAQINASGRFSKPLMFQQIGTLGQDDFGFYAFTFLRSGDRVDGPVVTLGVAKAEGWTRNPKYKTMPDLMLRYRAASLFANTCAPDIISGLPTVEEMEDIGSSRDRSNTTISINPVSFESTQERGGVFDKGQNLAPVNDTPAVQTDRDVVSPINGVMSVQSEPFIPTISDDDIPFDRPKQEPKVLRSVETLLGRPTVSSEAKERLADLIDHCPLVLGDDVMIAQACRTNNLSALDELIASRTPKG